MSPPPPLFFFFLLFVCSWILVWGVKMMKILALGYLSDFVTTNFKMSFLSNDLLSWTYTIFCCLQGPYKLFSPNTPTFHKLQEKKICFLFFSVKMQRTIWERRIRDILLSIHCFISYVRKKKTPFLAQFYNELHVRKSNVFSPHCTANKIKTNPITVLWRYGTFLAWCHFELGDNSYMGELSKHHTGEPQWQGRTYIYTQI